MAVQQVFLSPLWTILVDSLAWFFFHMGISIAMLKISDSFFETHETWFHTWEWEKSGAIWQDIFFVQSWKHYLPDGSFFLRSAYNKSSIANAYLPTLEKLLLEMRRAEMTHWLSMLPAFLFFFWNPPWAGWIMILYAILMNIPFIIVQRYNRPRLERIYRKKQKRMMIHKKKV